jgi:hypothetical protein
VCGTRCESALALFQSHPGSKAWVSFEWADRNDIENENSSKSGRPRQPSSVCHDFLQQIEINLSGKRVAPSARRDAFGVRTFFGAKFNTPVVLAQSVCVRVRAWAARVLEILWPGFNFPRKKGSLSDQMRDYLNTGRV